MREDPRADHLGASGGPTTARVPRPLRTQDKVNLGAGGTPPAEPRRPADSGPAQARPTSPARWPSRGAVQTRRLTWGSAPQPPARAAGDTCGPDPAHPGLPSRGGLASEEAARGQRPTEAWAGAGAPAHVGCPLPQRARGPRATPSPRSAAAPTGPRMLSRFLPLAGQACLRLPGASGRRRRRPGAQPWSLELSARAHGRGWPHRPPGAVVCGPAPRARRSAARTTSPMRPCGRLGRDPESDGATMCGCRPTREGPHPRVTTNSAAHNPWKKVNKHLFDTVIFNTYS